MSAIKLGRFLWNLVHYIRNKFAAKTCKRFPPHLNNVSIYTLPCENQNAHLITECGGYCKRMCSKYASLIWTHWNIDWDRSGPNWITSSLPQPFVIGVVDISWSLTCVLCTFSRNILTQCKQMDSHLAYLEAIVETVRKPWILPDTLKLSDDKRMAKSKRHESEGHRMTYNYMCKMTKNGNGGLQWPAVYMER